MSLRSVRLAGLLLMLLGAGCAAAGRPWTFAQASADSEDRTVPHTSDQDRQTPPKQPTGRLTAANDRSDSRNHRHDPATQRLIEMELLEASAEERNEWLEYLANVDTEMVPHILRARRIASEPKASQETSAPVAADAVRPASREREGSGRPFPIVPTAHAAGDTSPGTDLARRNTTDNLNAAPPDQTQRPADSSGSELEAPEPGTGLGWPQRFRSLTDWDANPLWPNRSDDAPPPREKSRSERGPFGLPQILGNSSRSSGTADEREPKPFRSPGNADSESRMDNPVDLGRIRPMNEVVTRMERSASTSKSGQMRFDAATSHWEEELLRLLSLMEAETSSSASGDGNDDQREALRKQVTLRMLYLISNQPEMAQQAIPNISREEQEFWTSIFWGLSNYLDEQEAANPSERATRTITQLHAAIHHLQQSAQLQVRNLTFCEQIDGFGSYEQFERDHFSPGQSVLLYCEIRNFKSQPTVDGYYRTAVKSTVELIRSGNRPDDESRAEGRGVDGKLIDRNVFPTTEDLCRSLRSDYYHSYRIDLPTHLTPGPHVLKLTLQDELSGKITSETIHLTIK